MKWEELLTLASDASREVIETGPMPLKEYARKKVTMRDRRIGIVTFKSGPSGMKPGKAAVVHYNPEFAWPKWQPDYIPEEVMELHQESNVEDIFEQI